MKQAAVSIKNRTLGVIQNRKVQIGITVVVTAVVTTLISRSRLFETKYTLDEVVDIVNEVLIDYVKYPIE